MANWNLECSTCHEVQFNVECSIYAPPKCNCGGEQLIAPTSMRAPQHNIFPFTVPHVNGKPMEITSMHHLRQVERNYGVAFSAFNKNNIHDLDPLKDVPKFRGNEPNQR